VEVNQRHLYCNAILDGVWLNERTGRFGNTDVRAAVGYLLTNEAFRDYWVSTREKRLLASTNDGPEARYFRVIDELFDQYR
jgi:hypothetical protein